MAWYIFLKKYKKFITIQILKWEHYYLTNYCLTNVRYEKKLSIINEHFTIVIVRFEVNSSNYMTNLSLILQIYIKI